MKLKVRPNGRRSQRGLAAAQRQICARLAVSILLSSAAATVTCLEAQASDQAASNATTPAQPEVGNLRLESDFRAVRLLWSYEPTHSEQEAATFDVRYCELTSWNIEIKCRHRELGLVEANSSSSSSSSNNNNNNNHNHSTVIEPNNSSSPGVARRLDRTSYEAQIFDLRALTNYTFQVHVARFRHQPQVRLSQGQSWAAGRRREGGRGLEAHTAAPAGRQARVETKAFAAEATKCLAESSEVVVQTGRHFGGRISVEDSADARCQLLGNRSSEQSSYLFRIDHQACQSRLVDGSRIETMVLVHENKDILTHNTARFLVLCNFQQRAFTLRASVSLPRVQGQLAGAPGQRESAPALVTALGSRASGAEPTRPVMLGSMPGLYRSLAPPPQAAHPPEDVGRREQLQELETNTISGGDPRPSKEQQRLSRQSKGLSADQSQPETRSLLLPPPPPPPLEAPKPVQVQSKVLYVERAPEGSLSARSGRQHHLHPKLLVAGRRHLNVTSAATATPTGGSGGPIGADPGQLRPPADLIPGSSSADELAAPIIMTNNHRLSSAPGQRQMEMATSHRLRSELAAGQLRARSGRMRNMETALNRMGEVASSAPAPDELSAAETSAELRQLVLAAPPHLSPANLSESTQVGGPSLAQNLTGYLLKWSLKQLTSLARKSLESLAVAASNETMIEDNSRLEARLEFKAPTRAPWSPVQPPTSAASDTTSVSWPAADETASTTTTTTTSSTTSTEAARTAKDDDSADGFITSGGGGGDKSVDLWPPVSARQPERRREAGELGAGLGQQPHRSHEGQRQARGGSLMVGLLAACALAACLLLVACLALARPRARRQAAAAGASLCQDGLPQEQSSYRRCSGEQAYGKLAGCASPAASSANRLLLLDDARSASSLSPEADCKTSELLFAQHVLVQTGRAPGESYA